jgi:hypothetical protein
MKTELTAEYVREALDYNPETGDLVWKARPIWHFKDRRIMDSWNSRYVGLGAGTPVNPSSKDRNNYYLHMLLDKKSYLVHRIIWMHVHGSFPEEQIDHINNDRKDNRLTNLREATAAQNQHNKPLQVNNTSGSKGLYFDKTAKSWLVRVNREGKTVFCERRKSREEAEKALREYREKEHLEFANHG